MVWFWGGGGFGHNVNMIHGSLGLWSRRHGDEHQHGNDTLIHCIRIYVSIL